MLSALNRTNLARRYLYASIAVALVPLLLVAAAYDRYSKQLIDTVFESRVSGDLDAVAVQMNSTLNVQIHRLENIVDLAATASFFQDVQGPIDQSLLDFLLLEAESSDVYAIELSDARDLPLASLPLTGAEWLPASPTTPLVTQDGTDVIGPVLGGDTLPGWFLLRRPVVLDHVKVGSVALRMRLASLTELMAPLAESGVFRPRLSVFDRLHLSATATPLQATPVSLRSDHIIPGWRIDLVPLNHNLTAPRQQLRLMLLAAAVALAVVLGALFVQMSRRLDRHLRPLKDGAEAVARGDFDTAIDDTAPGELGAVAQAFNSMRRQLRGMINSRVESERRAALGNLAAGFAHEIRNPLATVNAAIYGLRSGETETERLAMYREISDEVARMDETIEEFLNYARPSPPQPEPVTVGDVFASMRRLTAAQLSQAGVTLNLSGESNLSLLIDPAHLRQILLNLILNAAQALPDGGTVTLSAYRSQAQVRLEVSDDGVGMDEATRAQVLQPFFSQRSGGTGLGLPITAELVRSNGGDLTVLSELGVGTHMIMNFPHNEATP